MSNEACEIAEVYSISEPVARKEYRCCECSAKINVGEKHLKVFMAYGSDHESHRQHADCARVCEAIRDNDLVEMCLAWGSLKEWWWEEGKHIDKKREPMKTIRGLYSKVLKRERQERP